MSWVLVIMLISPKGVALSTIEGFSSKLACEVAQREVMEVDGSGIYRKVEAICIGVR